MPPRFRRPEPMTTFELVPDDEREDDDLPGSPDDPDDRPGRLATLRDRAVDRWRRLSRRGQVLVAGSTSVVLLAAATAAVGPGVLDAHDQRVRADAVRGLPGVVDDLSEPVAPTWALPAGTRLAALLPGDVLVAGDGRDVMAVDAGTGATVWEHSFDVDTTCGSPSELPSEVPETVETVVCVSADASTVTVLDPAGAVVAERALDRDGLGAPGADRSDRQALPAAGGAVALLDGSPFGALSVEWDERDDPSDTLRALRAAGWHDPTLRLEDALTGEVRAELTVALTPADLTGCDTGEDADGTRLSPAAWVSATPTYTVVAACGVRRTLTASGAEIEGDDVAGSLSATPGGGYLVPGDTSRLLDADGTVRATVDGWVVRPSLDTAPDGPELALRADGDRPVVTAVGDDGRALWSWRSPVTTITVPLARVGDTLVLADESTVTGLDAATGEERWRLDALVSDDPEAGEHVAGTATDGTRLLLAIPSPTIYQDGGTGEMRSGYRLVAVDLRDGTVAWESHVDDDVLWGLYAVGGHLVTSGDGASGLG